MKIDAVLRSDFTSPVLGVSILILFFVGAFISYHFHGYTKNILLANINNLIQIENTRDESNNSRKAGYWLNAFFLLVLSLLLYSSVDSFFTSQYQLNEVSKLFLCFAAILLGFTLKFFIKKLLGIVFQKEELTSIYFTQTGVKDKAFGIVIFPLLILYTFSLPLKEIAFYGILVISGVYLILRWVNGVIIGIKQGNLPYFYSILYICTLEIIPVALAVKVFSEAILSLEA